MRSKYFLAVVLTLSCSYAIAQAAAQNQPPAAKAKKPTAAASTPQAHDDEGDRIFHQNCSRCHNAPEGFPSSISGTIVRHMRVRASLSEEDTKKLLHFLNP